MEAVRISRRLEIINSRRNFLWISVAPSVEQAAHAFATPSGKLSILVRSTLLREKAKELFLTIADSIYLEYSVGRRRSADFLETGFPKTFS